MFNRLKDQMMSTESAIPGIELNPARQEQIASQESVIPGYELKDPNVAPIESQELAGDRKPSTMSKIGQGLLSSLGGGGGVGMSSQANPEDATNQKLRQAMYANLMSRLSANRDRMLG